MNKMKTKNLNFIEAVEAMKEGKKVRRESWVDCGEYLYWDESSDSIMTEHNRPFHIVLISQYEATDWEVVSEMLDFPSLKDTKLFRTEIIEIPDGNTINVKYFPERVLRDTCIDKARVKKLINEMKVEMTGGWLAALETLEEELGL